MFNGIIQTILVAFSTKTSEACTSMLSSENDYFNFLKTAHFNLKSTCSRAFSSMARGTVLSLH